MAGTTRGPDPVVPWDEFVLTYLRAREQGRSTTEALRALGMSDRRIERSRTMAARQGWMPYGRVKADDVPVAREMLAAKLRAVAAEREAKAVRRARRAHNGQVRRMMGAARRREQAERQQQSAPVILDLFGW